MKVSTLTRPFVSVIMPVRNEGTFIKKSLGALLCQTCPNDRFEIIIADGMSSDNTRKLIGSRSTQSDISIKIADRIRERMGDVSVTFETVSMLPRTAASKLRAVICELPENERR